MNPALLFNFFSSRLGIGLLGALAFGASTFFCYVKTTKLESEMVKMERRINQEIETRIKVTQDRDNLAVQIDNQNAKIEQLKLESDRLEVEKQRIVGELRRKLEKDRKAILDNPNSGNEEMNRWLNELFAN